MGLRLMFQPWWVQWLVYAAFMTVGFGILSMLGSGDPDGTPRWTQPVWWGIVPLVGVVVGGLLTAVQAVHRPALQELLAGWRRSSIGRWRRLPPSARAPTIR